MIASTLHRVLSQTADRELDSKVINNLHRSIQFLPNAHPMRSLFLAGVGEIYVIRFRHSQCQDALNKAVDIFQEAMLMRRGTILKYTPTRYNMALPYYIASRKGSC
jgi:hypothetical protein